MKAVFKQVQFFIELCKPRVVALMILTSIVGMQLAVPGVVPLKIMLWGNLGIALMAFGAAAMNHFIDRQVDAAMDRTRHRPLPSRQLTVVEAVVFSLALTLAGFLVLLFQVNLLAALLTLLTFIGYAFIYTAYLKHATPQNIVIGGLSGAMPPLLGWVSVTGRIDPQALLLVLLIFIWTPPHFWALAIYRHADYARARIPMLPNTHGIPYTALQILLYTVLLFGASILPFCIGMSGWIYFGCAILLSSRFSLLAGKLYYAARLNQSDKVQSTAIQTFRFSIWYLMLLFLALLVDHWGVR